MAGIYLHIPFCRQACSYCDFYFLTRTSLRPRFVDALISEIRSWSGRSESDRPAETVYMGGGTPSQLRPDEMERIFRALRETFTVQPGEITVEMNPDDVSRDYLRHLKDLGVNRASMGVQSFDEERLRFMNRAHSASEAHRALELLASEGFRTFTVDLIYGSPGQTLEQIEKDLDQLLAYRPPHVSAYALTIEPRTRLGRQLELGRLKPADDEQVTAQMSRIRDWLSAEGIRRYEVSNFSRPGSEAIHNRRYWNHSGYLGLGPSAHSFWWDEQGARRWENSRDLNSYLRSWTGPDPSPEKVRPEWLTSIQLAEERLMLGLRTCEGVTVRELEERYDYRLVPEQLDWLNRKASEGLLDSTNDRIRLTEGGFALADYLVLELIRRYGE